jgi:tetratricopeptide (TPR) repeat protein
VNSSQLKRIFRAGIICVFFLLGGVFVAAQDKTELLSAVFDYIEQNQLDSAEITLKTVLRNDPDNPINPFLLNNLGTIQRRQGKFDEALLSYTAALGTYPLQTVFLESRASLFAEMEQPQNAIIDYSTLLNENPNYEEALYQRGLLYLQIKNTDLAETDFRRMLDLYPNSLQARIGFASLAKFRGEYEEAEKIYNFLLDKEPENPNLYAGRAELYLLMKRPGKASSDINRAFRLVDANSENPYFYIIRYRAKLLLHETQGAYNDLKKAIALGYKYNENTP